MSKFTEIQTRKLVSAYGGVGSIIETTKGALIIEPFDKWRYFIEVQHGSIEPIEVEDNRLLMRLKYYFPNLRRLLKVPANVSSLYGDSQPQDKEYIVDSKYFPKWMYCSNCGRFKDINAWWEGWRNSYRGSPQNMRDSFIPPKCYVCYNEAREKDKRRYSYELEQVRFIMTAPDGSIKDIPWERWNIAIKNEEDNDSDKGVIDLQEETKECCNNQDLRYDKSTKFFDLSGVTIRCNNCGMRNTLAGLFGLRLSKIITDKEGNKRKIFFKPVIRTSNSVYYPIIINSLFLPQEDILTPDDKASAKNLFENKGKSIEEIAKILNVPEKALRAYLEPSSFITENEYRLKEYNFITSTSDANSLNANLAFSYEDISTLANFGISKLVKIKKLKLTSVQTGYSRQEPIDKDLFAQEGDDFIKLGQDKFLKAKFTSTKGNKTDYLPAIESYGEGVFISLEKKRLDSWFSKNWKDVADFRERIGRVQKNARSNEFIIMTHDKKERVNDAQYTSKFILLHTLSHILIKELEFVVGYPATSLAERLYVNSAEMQGFLIYTIAGAEGSYGGLITQANAERFEKILRSALLRAKDCASDPVCYYSDEQGIGGLNLAACYSCALLPETSCEEFNSFLDRALLIDEKFGFFRI